MGDIRDPLEAERLLTVAPDAFHTRRDFLKRTAVTAGLAAGMGLVLDPDTLVAEAARRQREVQLPSPRNLPIDTFVVLMMENRSFDHYLGWLPGADGRQAGLRVHRQPRATRSPPTACGPTSRAAASSTPTTPGRAGGPSSTAGAWTASSRRPERRVLDRLLHPERPAVHAPRGPGVHRLRSLLLLAAVLDLSQPRVHARRPVLRQDRQLAARRATASRTRRSSPRCPRPASPTSTSTPTSRCRRCGARRAWRAQARSRPSTSRPPRARCPPCRSWIPSFKGEDQGTSGDEHPHGDVRVGQAFIADVVHAFMESPQYKRGALFIVYDEWGGFFDHVVPPRVPDLRSSPDLNQDFGQMGFRIPAVVVSPYARRGHVDHSIYGFESILKMIRYRYGLPPLTPRDLYANNIAAAFDFEHPQLHAAGAAPARRRSSPRPAAGRSRSTAAGPASTAARRRSAHRAAGSPRRSAAPQLPSGPSPTTSRTWSPAATSSGCTSTTSRPRRRPCSAIPPSSGCAP